MLTCKEHKNVRIRSTKQCPECPICGADLVKVSEVEAEPNYLVDQGYGLIEDCRWRPKDWFDTTS